MLDDAVNWCKERGVEFYAVNKDFPEEDVERNVHFSRKLKVDMWIDDRNIGGIPDWGTIYRIIKEGITWEQVILEESGREIPEPSKKKHWWSL